MEKLNFFGHVYEIQLPDNACIVGYTLEKSLGCVYNVLLNRVWFSGSWVLKGVFDFTISHLQEDVFLVSIGTVWSDAAVNWELKGQLRLTGCHQQAVSFWSMGRWFKRYIYLAITHVKYSHIWKVIYKLNGNLLDDGKQYRHRYIINIPTF